MSNYFVSFFARLGLYGIREGRPSGLVVWQKVRAGVRRSHLLLRHEEWFRNAFKASGDGPEEDDAP